MSPKLPASVRVAIIGAGFSGLGMAIRLKRAGVEDFVVLEKGDGVGGTWWHNTYPGCRCDTPSHLYSFGFAPNPGWTETYARQPEIQAYLESCAQREGITDHIRLGTELTDARWDDTAQCWRLRTSRGDLTATALVAGTGALNEPKIPDIPGLADFDGEQFHSAEWRHDVDLSGKRVAVVGTGASAIQIIPAIASDVAHLDVFQRTLAWVPPHTGRRITGLERLLYRTLPAAQRLPRAAVYYLRELLVLGWTRWRRPTRVLEQVCRAHLRRQVRDPEVRARLTPDYRIGCKRLCPSNTYYPTFNRDNVELVTESIQEVKDGAVVTSDGVAHPVDVIVFATGFHVTDAPIQSIVHGRDGTSLAERWQGSPRAYLGTTVSGYRNLFLLLGPNTGNLTTSVVLMIESQLEYVLSSLRVLDQPGVTSVEVRPEAQAAYNAELQAKSASSVWLTGGCESWYLDRSGENATLWPDFSWRFDARTRSFEPADHLTENRT